MDKERDPFRGQQLGRLHCPASLLPGGTVEILGMPGTARIRSIVGSDAELWSRKGVWKTPLSSLKPIGIDVPVFDGSLPLPKFRPNNVPLMGSGGMLVRVQEGVRPLTEAEVWKVLGGTRNGSKDGSLWASAAAQARKLADTPPPGVATAIVIRTCELFIRVEKRPGPAGFAGNDQIWRAGGKVTFENFEEVEPTKQVIQAKSGPVQGYHSMMNQQMQEVLQKS